MTYAQNSTAVTETKSKRGHVTSSVKAVSKRGQQRFKFQEIQERREAIAERLRKEEETAQAKIKEAEFIKT